MLILYNLIVASLCLKVFASEDSTNIQCPALCEGTYSPHTYEKNDAHEICKRGCRLMSVAELTTDNDDLESAKQSCKADCHDAYPNVEDSASMCAIGCDFQAKVSSEKPQVNEAQLVFRPMFPGASGVYDQMVMHMMQRMEFMMNIMNTIQQQDPQDGEGDAPTGFRIIRIYSFSNQNDDGAMPMGPFMSSENAAQDVADVKNTAESRCPLSFRWRRLVLLALLVLSAVLLTSIIYAHMTHERRATGANAKRTPAPMTDDDDCLLLSKTDMYKLALDDEGLLAVHGEAGPLPIKAKI